MRHSKLPASVEQRLRFFEDKNETCYNEAESIAAQLKTLAVLIDNDETDETEEDDGIVLDEVVGEDSLVVALDDIKKRAASFG
jgi:hypothetical protein